MSQITRDKTKSVKRLLPGAAEGSFRLCAWLSLLALGLILGFLLIQGLPALQEIGFFQFLFGTEWKPKSEEFGILPMIVASLLATIGAIVIGGSIGLFAALFLAEIAPPKVASFFRAMVNLLAGIPSVVYGFFGLVVIVPFISNYLGGPGNSLLAAIIILSVMILPTLVSLSETALRAVPQEYREGSLALGASPIQTIFKVVIPAARSGIVASFILGVGRAIGETMAVILVVGNRVAFPTSILDPVRPLTANIAMELSYATGLHREALYATGVILLLFIVIINLAANVILNGRRKK